MASQLADPLVQARPALPDDPGQETVRRRWRHRLAWLLGIRLSGFEHYSPRPLRVPACYTVATPLPNPPVISIVTPSFNQGPFLERTMRSVLDQNYPRLEYMVQDGGSTDETASILERYHAWLHRRASRPDHGQANAINIGFAHATGEIMAYLNSDDLLLPGTLNYVAAWFAAHPEVDVVYGHRVIVDAQDQEIGRWVLPPHSDDMLIWADYVPQETLFWRRRIWDRAGGAMDESFQFALDWDLLLRFRAAGAKMARLPRFLGAFRIHDAQKTREWLATYGLQEMKELRRRHHGRAIAKQEVRQALLGYVLRHAWCNSLYRCGLLRY